MVRADLAELIADDGVRLTYTEHGDPAGRPVVLLAGFKAPASSWRYQLGPLAGEGLRVLAVDLRGHGAADRPASGVDMDRRADDVRDLMDGLDLRDAVLVGGSMGGNTIWAHLSRHGAARVAGIVIVDQTPRMLNSPDWPHGFYGYDESNRDTFFTEGIPQTGHGTPPLRRGMRLVRLLRAMSGVDRDMTPGELTLLADHAQRDWRPAIAASDIPVLFVAGADSEFWPSSHAAASAALAPNGRAVTIANDGHAANMERPGVFNRELLAFIRSLG